MIEGNTHTYLLSQRLNISVKLSIYVNYIVLCRRGSIQKKNGEISLDNKIKLMSIPCFSLTIKNHSNRRRKKDINLEFFPFGVLTYIC